MVFVIVILVVQCVLMLWTLLPALVNQVMLGMEHCVLPLMNVRMVPIIVILVLECVLILWAFTCSCKSGYARNGTLCTGSDECADGTDICHPGPAMCTNALAC